MLWDAGFPKRGVVLKFIDSENEASRFRDFQSLFYVASQPSIEDSLRLQLRRWLSEKGFSDISLEDSGYYPRDGRDLRFVHSVSSDGIAYQARLAETTETGTWRSSFTFSIPRNKQERGWLLVRISNDQGIVAKTPRLIGYLVEEQLVVDGDYPMPPEAQIYRDTMLEQLFDEIKNEERRMPVFVAATDTTKDFDDFHARAKGWAQKLPGLAHFVILDPPASQRWREVLGDEFAVPSWTVRSYLPGVSLENNFDPRRHKILGHSRLSEPVSRVRSTLERIARGIVYQEIFPDYVHSTMKRLQRLEDRAMIDAITLDSSDALSDRSLALDEAAAKLESNNEALLGQSVAEGAEQYLAKLNLVEKILGLGEITKDSLEQLAKMAHSGFKAQSALESLTTEFMARQDKVEELNLLAEELETAISEIDGEVGQLEEENRNLAIRLRNLEKKNEWLLRQVDDNQKYSAEYLAFEVKLNQNPPADWEDFVQRVSSLTEYGIIFSGDPKLALEIEQNDDWGNIVRVAWDCIEVLVAYTSARRDQSWSQGVDEFIAEQGVFPARKHARNETGYTRKLSMKDKERDFPVPQSVSATGFATMFAHFKLGKKGRIDPRMYYLDNFSIDGQIYIGYVGVHLKNRQTN